MMMRRRRKLRNEKAAGPDNIQPELIKYAEQPVTKALHDLFQNLVWSTGRVPADWKASLNISVFKGKGQKANCSSYSPISLLSVSWAVLFSAVKGAQASPVSHVVVAELQREFDEPLHTAFIDIRPKSIDDRDASWTALAAKKAPPFLIRLIQDLHSFTTARVKIGEKLSNPFHATSGVRH